MSSDIDSEELGDALLQELANVDPVAAAQQDEQEAKADAKRGKQCIEHIQRAAYKMAPASKQEYAQWTSLNKHLPNPILQQAAAAAAGDEQRAQEPVDPIAMHCSGATVTYFVPHWLPTQCFWQHTKCGGSKSGMPPCPNCYDRRKQQVQQPRQQQQAGQQLQEQQQQQQQQASPFKLMQWDPSVCGTVTSVGWNKPPQRVVGFGDNSYMCVYQYICKGCPGGPQWMGHSAACIICCALYPSSLD
jgi:hypothetical protein